MLQMVPPGPSVANYVTIDGPPDQVRLPQMVPLKLSLEMMSRGSYEVNLANMYRVIIIII